MLSKAHIFDKLALPLLVVGGVLVTVAFVLAFTVAPLVSGEAVSSGFLEIDGHFITNKLLLSQKIFYFHMPVAVVSMAALLFTAIYSILFLKTRESSYDLRARLATEVSLVFVLMTMVSGELWERYEWGVWWTWEPRLTTYFILMLLVVGYFIVRNAVSDPERRAVYSSVLGIIIFIDVPICFMVTRLIPSSVHPVIFRTDSGLPPPMLIPLLMALVGFGCIAFALYRQRLRAEQLRERVEALKIKLDEATDPGRE
ncbi:MAG: cytochrome c biogenesis protein CcsA [Coriobacteriales bacterium]|jgi:heme exporter protein C|nr:cytochrome c biogenesis protein CcsA [Coriobacteriales bacterium]